MKMTAKPTAKSRRPNLLGRDPRGDQKPEAGVAGKMQDFVKVCRIVLQADVRPVCAGKHDQPVAAEHEAGGPAVKPGRGGRCACHR